MKIKIDNSLIDYVKNDLNEIKYHLANIKCWNEEIALAEAGDIYYTDLDIHNTQNKIRESESKIKQMNLYINQLDQEEAQLIKLRYFTKNKRNLSYDNIALKLHYAKSKLKKMNDDAIKMIAYYKYIVIANTSYKKHENEMRTNKEQSVNTMRTEKAI